jgi:hypothetical protein
MSGMEWIALGIATAILTTIVGHLLEDLPPLMEGL